ncbi:MAG: response regulator [Candidatus Synoicihabitans palmerolidicus]|nr:response regulator [Candidatus Synoicihabitans palmerolidicus]
MSAEVLEHIFEPFFTTKEVGTGLGLATVHGIIEEHHGWIEVQSGLGRGTTFFVFLPTSAPLITTSKPPATSLSSIPRGQESILLIEAETPVRAVASIMLRRLGYQVIEADSPSRALELWPQYQNDIRLVLTDMMMPGGMTGVELAKSLRVTSPDLSIVLMSGYSDEISEAKSLQRTGIAFLAKPFELALLAETVRQTLDQNNYP